MHSDYCIALILLSSNKIWRNKIVHCKPQELPILHAPEHSHKPCYFLLRALLHFPIWNSLQEFVMLNSTNFCYPTLEIPLMSHPFVRWNLKYFIHGKIICFSMFHFLNLSSIDVYIFTHRMSRVQYPVKSEICW